MRTSGPIEEHRLRLDGWLLTDAERDNPGTELPAWSDGNQVSALVHGTAYFGRLVEVVDQMGDGDLLLSTDGRGDPDQLLRPDGPTVAELLSAAAAHRGVHANGLVWRSHPSPPGCPPR